MTGTRILSELPRGLKKPLARRPRCVLRTLQPGTTVTVDGVTFSTKKPFYYYADVAITVPVVSLPVSLCTNLEKLRAEGGRLHHVLREISQLKYSPTGKHTLMLIGSDWLVLQSGWPGPLSQAMTRINEKLFALWDDENRRRQEAIDAWKAENPDLFQKRLEERAAQQAAVKTADTVVLLAAISRLRSKLEMMETTVKDGRASAATFDSYTEDNDLHQAARMWLKKHCLPSKKKSQ